MLSLRGSAGASPVAPWETPELAETGVTRMIDSTTLAYEVVAYVVKEFLDDASDEYRSSPVGAYLRREDPAQYSRSTLPLSKTVLFMDSPASLRYRVRGGTTLGDLWSTLQKQSDTDHSGLSLNPKFGAGKAGFVLSLRW